MEQDYYFINPVQIDDFDLVEFNGWTIKEKIIDPVNDFEQDSLSELSVSSLSSSTSTSSSLISSSTTASSLSSYSLNSNYEESTSANSNSKCIKPISLVFYHYLYYQKLFSNELNPLPLYIHKNESFTRKQPKSILRKEKKAKLIKELKFRNYGIHKAVENYQSFSISSSDSSSDESTERPCIKRERERIFF